MTSIATSRRSTSTATQTPRTPPLDVPPPEGFAAAARGILYAMIVTMDRAGRLVIPREVRREAAIEPGVPLEIRSRDGVIEIEPRPLAVTLERKGRLLVARPATPVPALGSAEVERTRRRVRRGRG